MDQIETARNEINEIDALMAGLFEKRMKACEKIAVYKKEKGLKIRDAAREKTVIRRNRSLIQDPDIRPYYVDFLENIISLSCRYQSELIDDRTVKTEG